ncbi:pirin family protein [Larsenimonas suaedae]|uniref:Pirin family protein n=1 Tax=Larsenimonas suaedae TaxID=1851019 RepID=A0ABU1GY11_9GAMM|nr:pirin family protein [Larsenimonas suaedae]MCM2973014.1 pirin family protein [Larsenimonas suaedae]MDR5896451.1 pirin family protein [Larsenimonas suaedae]
MSEFVPRRMIACHPAYRDDIGDLMTRRPLPGPGVDQLDPFLFLNHHGPQTYPAHNDGLPFGPHPHRGFETVTFVLDGVLEHADSSDHQSVIHAGGVQWMTAGRGIVHSERSPEDFKRRGGALEILQLWINLPSRLKMTPPAYKGLEARDLPTLDLGDGSTMTLISGAHEAHQGPIQSLTDVMLGVIALSRGAHLHVPVPRGRQLFFYIVDGELTCGDDVLEAHHLVEFDREGEGVVIDAVSDARVIIGHAEPIEEPVVMHGPFVMTSADEIRRAIADYQAGRFEGL